MGWGRPRHSNKLQLSLSLSSQNKKKYNKSKKKRKETKTWEAGLRSMADRLGSSISSSSAKSLQRMTATFLPFGFCLWSVFLFFFLTCHSIGPRQAEGDAHISLYYNRTGRGQRRWPALSIYGSTTRRRRRRVGGRKRLGANTERQDGSCIIHPHCWASWRLGRGRHAHTANPKTHNLLLHYPPVRVPQFARHKLGQWIATEGGSHPPVCPRRNCNDKWRKKKESTKSQKGRISRLPCR